MQHKAPEPSFSPHMPPKRRTQSLRSFRFWPLSIDGLREPIHAAIPEPPPQPVNSPQVESKVAVNDNDDGPVSQRSTFDYKSRPNVQEMFKGIGSMPTSVNTSFIIPHTFDETQQYQQDIEKDPRPPVFPATSWQSSNRPSMDLARFGQHGPNGHVPNAYHPAMNDGAAISATRTGTVAGTRANSVMSQTHVHDFGNDARPQLATIDSEQSSKRSLPLYRQMVYNVRENWKADPIATAGGICAVIVLPFVIIGAAAAIWNMSKNY